jgi:hypothetical protein
MGVLYEKKEMLALPLSGKASGIIKVLFLGREVL